MKVHIRLLSNVGFFLLASLFCAINTFANQEIKAWGNNSSGRLGLGDTTVRYSPTTIVGFSGVQAIAGGEYHTLALMSDGTAKAWGRNNDGRRLDFG